MFIEERHQAILTMLEDKQRISIEDIQQQYGISAESARRDLRILEERGLLKRTHGGALPMQQVAMGKPPKMTARDIPVVKGNYLAIARKAVSMIRDNDVVFLTSATVGYLMARELPEDRRVRAVVNSIVIAEELRKKDNVSVLMLGGEMDQKGNCYDAFAIDMIRRLRMDRCFLTAASISPRFGLSIQKSQAILFWNAVMDSSKEVVGLFPTEKIGFESIVSLCPAYRLHKLITDTDASEEELTAFDEMGIEVVITEGQNEKSNTETSHAQIG